MVFASKFELNSRIQSLLDKILLSNIKDETRRCESIGSICGKRSERVEHDHVSIIHFTIHTPSWRNFHDSCFPLIAKVNQSTT